MQTAHIDISPVNMEDRAQIDIKSGDTVRVWVKVQEKEKTRLQPFEGIVLARKHGNEPGATFTVRRVSGGYGVEKIFPLYSPNIDKIEIIKRAKVRRAKLYHIRDKAVKQIKRQMRNMRFVDIKTVSDIEEKAKAEKAAQVAEEKAAQDPNPESTQDGQAQEVAEKAAQEKPAEDAPAQKEASEESKAGGDSEEKKEA